MMGNKGRDQANGLKWRDRAFAQMGNRAGNHGCYRSLPWKMS